MRGLIAAVQEATGGRGVDVVYDSVGGDVLHASRRVMAREGRLLVVGFASGELADLPTNHALYRNYDVVGVYFGGYSGPEDAGYRRDMWEELLGYARDGPDPAGHRPGAAARRRRPGRADRPRRAPNRGKGRDPGHQSRPQGVSAPIGSDVMSLTLKRGTSWWETYARCVEVAPEAFDSDRLRNLVHGEWRRVGTPGDHVTPIDGTPIPGPPRIDFDSAVEAVAAACQEHQDWAKVDLEERQLRVTEAVDALTAHRDLLALLLVWEIGKPWRLACADVDRALDGVRWYVGEIERQLHRSRGADARPRCPVRCPTSRAGTTR